MALMSISDGRLVVFFRTVAPVEPVGFVKDICEAAMSNRSRKRTRFAKRLSPMTLMGRASEEGLEKVAKEVLRPHFHQEPFEPCLNACRNWASPLPAKHSLKTLKMDPKLF